MNTHLQIHNTKGVVHPVCYSYMVLVGRKKRDYVAMCNVDKFFEQPQNRNTLGWIDTSPASASTPSAEAHISVIDSNVGRSDLKNEDLFETTLSRRCQTLAEVSALAKSLHQPTPSEYEDVDSVDSDGNKPSNAE